MPHKYKYFPCKHPDCDNLVRYEKDRSGYCYLHYDTSKRSKRFSEYNRTIKKVVPGMRLGELGLRTDETPFIITICDMCGQPYLATPASLRFQSKHFCSPECKGVYAARNTPNKNTSIERAIEQAIKERSWLCEKQVPLANITVADFFLPEFNAVVYCDGDFWHADQDSKERDTKQVEVLTRKGYNVFRFSETEINRSAHGCLDQIARSVKPLFRQLGLPIS